MRKGQHDGLISDETYSRIQDRLNGVNRMPTRRNLNEDFPLRLEDEFAALSRSVQPTENLFRVATSMLRQLWNHRLAQADTQVSALKVELPKAEKQVAQFLDRIIASEVPSVIAAFEQKDKKLEEDKLLIAERMANVVKPRSTFDQTVRTALSFLANPWTMGSGGIGRPANRAETGLCGPSAI